MPPFLLLQGAFPYSSVLSRQPGRPEEPLSPPGRAATGSDRRRQAAAGGAHTAARHSPPLSAAPASRQPPRAPPGLARLLILATAGRRHLTLLAPSLRLALRLRGERRRRRGGGAGSGGCPVRFGARRSQDSSAALPSARR